MNSAKNRLSKLFAKLVEDASVEALGPDRWGATRFEIHGVSGAWQLRAIWAGEGWPADVQSKLDSLPSDPWPSDLVLVAREYSPGALELLKKRRINWADERGLAHISGPGIFIDRNAPTERSSARPNFAWSPSTIATAEALLAKDWSAGIGTTELATLVDWSPPQVSQVLQAFDEKGWTVKYGPQRGPNAHRELADAEGLLSAWAQFITTQERDSRLAHRALRAPMQFLEDDLAQALNSEVRWALSGWGAAHELAPIADTVPSLQIYVHEDDFGGSLDRAIEKAGLSNVAEGGRVVFFAAPASVLTLSQRPGTTPIVSTPRVYADLLSFAGRGVDAATHLKDEVLDRLHPPTGHRQAPSGLIAWERECRKRLDDLVEDRPDLAKHYAQGTWSSSYRLLGIPKSPDLRKFMAILREVAGHETGWPPWWTPSTNDTRPRPVDGSIECWFAAASLAEWAEADYWRADPQGRLCLIRAYQEDSAKEPMTSTPGVGIDLTLPIWRCGECLLHAQRLAQRLDATRIQFMMRWTHLKGRKLGVFVNRRRRMIQTQSTAEDEVLSFVDVAPDDISANLSGIVRQLVDPLYTSFDFFEPPANIYEEELAAMRAGVR
jgi:hypothetical protein